MEYILSNILSQSKYSHKRVNSYTERRKLKLLWCPDGCLFNLVLSWSPLFREIVEISPVFIHVINLIGSGIN